MRATVSLGIAVLALGLVAAVYVSRGELAPRAKAVAPLERHVARGAAPRGSHGAESGETPHFSFEAPAARGSAHGGRDAALESVVSVTPERALRREALEGDDLPPPPEALPPDPDGPYGSKYAGLYPSDLELRQRELRRQQAELAEPLFEERFRNGRYRVLGPIPRFTLRMPYRVDEYPPALRPLVQSREVPLDERYQQLLVVEVHPHESPEIEALRAEELWLQARIDELEWAW